MSTNKLIARLHRPLIRTLVHAGVTSPDSYLPSNGPAASPSETNSYEFTGYRSCFTYDELVGITGGFSAANVIGEGGFGKVYMGALGDGRRVAVKQLKVGGGQGEKEFRAEVDIISRVHHKNLVSLVGFCIHAEQRLLVYEYVPNKTLESHLHHGTYTCRCRCKLQLLCSSLLVLQVLGLTSEVGFGWSQGAAARRWTGRAGGRSPSVRPRASRICTRTVSSSCLSCSFHFDTDFVA